MNINEFLRLSELVEEVHGFLKTIESWGTSSGIALYHLSDGNDPSAQFNKVKTVVEADARKMEADLLEALSEYMRDGYGIQSK